MADIDRFKSVNDKYGHATGDDVIRGVAATLAANCRSSDLVARYGGEEFAVLLPETGAAQALELAERLRQAIEAKAQGRNRAVLSGKSRHSLPL